jgi:regulatory protein
MNETKNLALSLLSQRSFFSTELAKKLKDKKCPPEEIPPVIEECRNSGYLNDEELLHTYIRTCLRKKMGPRAIAATLRSKGLDREVVDEALKGVERGPGQQEGIKKLLETRYALRNLQDYKERQKVILALMRKGYDLSAILECLSDL